MKLYYLGVVQIQGERILYIRKQVSKGEATARKGRKIKNTTSKRNSKNTKEKSGFTLNDKVKVFNGVGFISGFTSGGCYIKDIFGRYVTIPGKTYKQVSLSLLTILEHNNNWQVIPHLKEGDFLPERG